MMKGTKMNSKLVFIGNYSNNGIYLYELDEDLKKIERIKNSTKMVNTSYICKMNNYIYSVVEIQGDETTNSGYVIAYEIKNKRIKFLNKKSSFGKGPCFITVDSIRNFLYIGNYTGGSITIYKINKDGSIGKMIYHKKYGKESRIHNIQISNDRKKIYVVDLGLNIN